MSKSPPDRSALEQFSLSDYGTFARVWSDGIYMLDNISDFSTFVGIGRSTLYRYMNPARVPQPPLFGMALIFTLNAYLAAKESGVEPDADLISREAAMKAARIVVEP
jgi:predicted DNA-binding transcriptional regulator AlpA